MKTKRKTKILSLFLAVTMIATMIMALPIMASAASSSSTLASDWATIKSNVIIDITTYCDSKESVANTYYGIDDGPKYLMSGGANGYSSGRGNKIKNGNNQWFAIKVEGAATITAEIVNGGSNDRIAYIAKSGADTMSNKATDDTYANYYAKKSIAKGTTDSVVYKKTTSGEETMYFRANSDLYLKDITVTFAEPFEIVEEGIEVVKSGASIEDGTINYKYQGDVAPTIDFTSDKTEFTVTDNGGSNGTGTATVKVDPSVAVDTTATITANATIGSSKYTKSFTVTVVQPTKNLKFIASHGVKSVTITGKDNDFTQTVNYSRDGSHGACRSNGDNSTNGYGIFEKVPYGEYTVSFDVVDEYYDAVEDKTITVNAETNEDENIFDVVLSMKTDNRNETDINEINIQPGSVITWDFSSKSGAPNEYLKVEGTGVSANIISDTPGVTMFVASGGKFTSCESADSVQVKLSATSMKIPVIQGSVIVFDKNRGGDIASEDPDVKVDGTTITYNGTEKKYVTVTVKDIDMYINKISVINAPDNVTQDWINNSGTAGTWATKENGEYTLTYVKNQTGAKGFTYDLTDKVTGLPEGDTLATAKGKVRVSFDMYQDEANLPGDNYFVDLSSKIPNQFLWKGNDYGTKYGRLAGRGNGKNINFLANQISTAADPAGADKGRVEVGNIRKFGEWVNVSMMIDLSDLSKFTAEYDTGRSNASDSDQNRQVLTQTTVPTKSEKLYLNVQPDSSVNTSHDVCIKFRNIKAEYIEFGDGSSDSGRYNASGSPDNVLGIIRFFQSYLGTASEYGFVFIDSGGEIVTSDKISTEEVMTFNEETPGFYGDLKGIEQSEIDKTFKAKGFVKVGTDYYYSQSVIEATVGQDTITDAE